MPISHSLPQDILSDCIRFVFLWVLHSQMLGLAPSLEDQISVFMSPSDSAPTLSWWLGLSAPETLSAMPAVAYLLVGSPMPDRSRGRSQTKRDTLVLQVGGWA
jgi:hypothetical protein